MKNVQQRALRCTFSLEYVASLIFVLLLSKTSSRRLAQAKIRRCPIRRWELFLQKLPQQTTSMYHAYFDEFAFNDPEEFQNQHVWVCRGKIPTVWIQNSLPIIMTFQKQVFQPQNQLLVQQSGSTSGWPVFVLRDSVLLHWNVTDIFYYNRPPLFNQRYIAMARIIQLIQYRFPVCNATP